MHSLCSLLLRRVQQQTTNNAVLVARGGLKSLIPAINLDTLRGRRKGDPQRKRCGNEIVKNNYLFMMFEERFLFLQHLC